MMKKILIASVVAGCVVMALIIRNSSDDGAKFNISICKAIEHEALNSVAAGVQDYVRGKLGDRVAFKVDTCQGNAAIASQIISKFVSSKSDVVVAIGTMPAQVAYKHAQKGVIRLVFSSVTNPNNISMSLENANTTGVSNFVPLEPQIALFMKLQPNLKKLGIIYNAGETNSVDIVERLKDVVKEYGIELVEQSIQRALDIPQATEALTAKGVDAVFISNDNMALANIPLIVKLCGKVPVYVSDTDQVKMGCVASLGPNQYDIGVQTGKIIEKVLNGVDINTMKVEYTGSTELYLNAKQAAKVGINIPHDISALAKKIY
ncbi:MAG: ABC transporter substrate-binding protein [Holosporales bacterium]|jgi:putative ABC transport system substrate-binding protein|nr:ABC transporter substrate-binding protein [Holosporales bacterium]